MPHHVHVVDETRLYMAWGEGEAGAGAEAEAEAEPRVRADSGIVAAKRALNELHLELAAEGYDEVLEPCPPSSGQINKMRPNQPFSTQR